MQRAFQPVLPASRAKLASLLLRAGLVVTWLVLIGFVHAAQALCSDPRCLLEQALASIETSGKQSIALDKVREAVATSYAALGRSDEAAQIAERIEWPRLRVRTFSRLGLARALAGDRAEAAALFRRAAGTLGGMTGETDWIEPLISFVLDMARAGNIASAREIALGSTQGRLPWVKPMILARLAAVAEEVGAPDSALWNEATMLTTAFDFPNWNVFAMERVAVVADAAGHPDRALLLADAADDLMRTLPPRVLDATRSRWGTPVVMRIAALTELAWQGKFLEALAGARAGRARSWNGETQALLGEVLAAVALHIPPATRDGALADAMRRAVGEVTGPVQRQAEWLAEVGPAFGRLGDKADEATVFDRVERLAASLDQPAAKHGALVHLAVALYRAGQINRAAALLAQGSTLLDGITDPRAADLAAGEQLLGLAFTGQGEAAWKLATMPALTPRERSFRQNEALAVALAAGFRDQALWMRDQAASQANRDRFQERLARTLEEAGRLNEAHNAVAEIIDASAKAEAMINLAQAMIRAKGGPLRPGWVQLSPDPFTEAMGDIVLMRWPFWRNPPHFADIY